MEWKLLIQAKITYSLHIICSSFYIKKTSNTAKFLGLEMTSVNFFGGFMNSHFRNNH